PNLGELTAVAPGAPLPNDAAHGCLPEFEPYSTASPPELSYQRHTPLYDTARFPGQHRYRIDPMIQKVPRCSIDPGPHIGDAMAVVAKTKHAATVPHQIQ